MTLTYEHDLDNLKMYLHKVSRSRLSKFRARTDRNTHTHDQKHYHAVFAGGNIFKHLASDKSTMHVSCDEVVT